MKYTLTLIAFSFFVFTSEASDSCLTKFYKEVLTTQKNLENFRLYIDPQNGKNIIVITLNQLRQAYELKANKAKSFADFGIEMFNNCDTNFLIANIGKLKFYYIEKDVLYNRVFAMKMEIVQKNFMHGTYVRFDRGVPYELILAYFFAHRWITLDAYCPDYIPPHIRKFDCNKAL
jgi:hypothetical protein